MPGLGALGPCLQGLRGALTLAQRQLTDLVTSLIKNKDTKEPLFKVPRAYL